MFGDVSGLHGARDYLCMKSADLASRPPAPPARTPGNATHLIQKVSSVDWSTLIGEWLTGRGPKLLTLTQRPNELRCRSLLRWRL